MRIIPVLNVGCFKDPVIFVPLHHGWPMTPSTRPLEQKFLITMKLLDTFQTSCDPRVCVLCPAASNVFRNAPNSCAVDPAWGCNLLMTLSKCCPRCCFVICCLTCRWRCSAYLSSTLIWQTPRQLAVLGFNSLMSGCNRVTSEQLAVPGFNSLTSSCNRTGSDELSKC